MIILHAAPVTWKDMAGPNASVPGLVAAQHAMPDVEAALLTTVSGGWPPRCPFPVYRADSVCRRTGRPDVPAPFDQPDLVVFHSTYIPLHARIARFLRREAIPYLICPRGGMTRYAQTCKRFKKTAGNLLFFNRLVREAQAVHCLTAGEAAASDAWRTPSFVVGNGVELPSVRRMPSPESNRPLRIAFMGRLHIDHKGLDLLVDACGLIRRRLAEAGITVEIFGPDCAGGMTRLQDRIDRAGLADVVALRGPVVGAAKSEMLASTDVFVHPSRTEGHPIAVLEALAHGTACLLTPNTNMADEVVEAGAGWQVDASVEGISRGLSEIVGRARDELIAAGHNARELAESRYGWCRIAEQSVGQYRRFAA